VWEELLKVYGPMALGWVLFILERKDRSALQASLMTAFVGATAANVELKSIVQRMVDMLEKK